MEEIYQCSVCKRTINAKGEPFASEDAVAKHIHFMVVRRDLLHRSWALSETDLSESKIDRLDYKDTHKTLWKFRKAINASSPQVVGNHNDAQRINQSFSPKQLLDNIELMLHRHIKFRLAQEYKENWWRKGVPQETRVECSTRFERSEDGGEPFDYTYFIDLKAILEKQWPLFANDFGGLKTERPNKKDFLSHLVALNDMRNRYAHPTRSPKPGTQKYEEDLALARKMSEIIAIFTEESN